MINPRRYLPHRLSLLLLWVDLLGLKKGFRWWQAQWRAERQRFR
jgi:hypothetical protein